MNTLLSPLAGVSVLNVLCVLLLYMSDVLYTIDSYTEVISHVVHKNDCMFLPVHMHNA